MKLQTHTLFLIAIFFLFSCKTKKTNPSPTKEVYSEQYQSAKNLFESGDYINTIDKTDRLISQENSSPEEKIATYVLKGLSQKKIKYEKPNAAESFQKAIEIAGDNLQTKELGIAYHEYGSTLFGKEKDKAFTAWAKALKIKKATYPSNDMEIAKTLNNLAIYHYQVDGNILKAEKYYIESIDIRLENQNQESSIGRLYNSLGSIRYKLQDFQKAKLYFNAGEKVLITYLEQNPKDVKAIQNLNGIYNNLGALALEEGSLNTAKAQFEKSLETGEKIGSEHLMFLANFNLGRTARKEGNAELAISYLDIAKSKIGKIFPNDIENPYNLWMEYALVQAELKNDISAAKQYAEKAIDFLKSKGLEEHPIMYNAYNDMGSVFLDSERLDVAEKYFQSALKNPIKESIPSRLYSNLGMLFSRKGENKKAENYFQKAITHESELFSPQSKGLGGLKWRYANFLSETRRIPEAIKQLNEGLALLYNSTSEAESITDVSVLLKILGSKIELLRKENRLDEGFETAQLLSEINAKLDKELVNEEAKREQRELQNQKIELAVAIAFDWYQSKPTSEKAEKVFILLENFKAAILKEKVRKSNLSTNEDGLNALINKELSLKKEKRFLEELEKEGVKQAELNIKLKEIKSEITTQYPSYAQMVYQNQSLDLEKIIQKLSSSNSCLIEYFKSADTLYAFIIHDDEINLRKTILSPGFSNDLQKFIHLLKNKPEFTSKNFPKSKVQEFVDLSQFIYSETLKPISAFLEKTENLIVIPHGELFYLPFEVLISDKFILGNEDFGEVPYFCKDKSIRYEYSSGLLAMTNPNKKAQMPYLGLAPHYSNEMNDQNELPILDFNEKEISDVGGLMGGKTLEEKEANKIAFKKLSVESNIIHFAGHALIDLNSPDYSKLIFSGRHKENTLHSYELADLKFNADLAVLTACNTGQGALTAGEGTMSFARAFKAAGCQNSVTSMWQANDLCSPQFIFDFFTNLKDGLGKAKALNAARISFLQKNALDKRLLHPHYWGNFILIGDDEPIVAGGNKNWWGVLGVAGFLFFVVLVIFFRRKDNH